MGKTHKTRTAGRPRRDLPLPLLLDTAPGAEPIQRQLTTLVRRLVQRGALAPGAPLPSSRQLATQLGVSRTTTELAYEQLRAEGYLESRERRGTYVANALPDHFVGVEPRSAGAPPAAPSPARASRRSDALIALDPTPPGSGHHDVHPFRTGTPWADPRLTMEIGRRAARLWRRGSHELLYYGEPAGYAPLRAAIARHVAVARGVRATAEQVIITSGAQQALGVAAQLAFDPGDTVWIEDPGYVGARSAMRAAGARLAPMDVDEDGLDVDRARRRAPRARAAYVTPSHQYPLGGTLSAARRYALLAWARDAHAWIIEDDYDSEFRYATHPLPALQGLDADGRVLYVGTFSKTLVPALRLGYLVVPRALAATARAARAVADRHAPTVEQAVLASLIDDGSYARHVRRMRLAYAERQAVLVEAVHEHLGDVMEVAPADAGMHLTGWLKRGWSEARVMRVAAEARVELSSLSRLSLRAPAREAVLLGYAAFSPAALRRAARHLAMALHGDRS